MITIGFISFEALGIIWGFGSLLAVGVMFDEKTDDHIWIWLMPITWVLMIFGGILMGIIWCYEHSIGKLNSWLDKDKKKKLYD